MTTLKEEIRIVIDALLKSATVEVMQEEQETVEELKRLLEAKGPIGFLKSLEAAQCRFNVMLTKIMDIPEQRYDGIIEHIVSGLYEHFWRRYMQRVEGSSCSSDKARFVVRTTFRALKENKNLSLYDDYMKYDQIVEGKEEQAYWSPRSVKDTDTAMESFVKWYYLKGGLNL